MEFVSFDRAKLKRFKTAHKKAKEEGKDMFVFEEKEYDFKYAQYMIEYLESRMKG
jgi:hypothetical protein